MNKYFTALLIILPIYSWSQKNISAEWRNFYDTENLLFSTTRIEVYIENKAKAKIDTATGTCFIFSFEIDSVTTYPILVTNKHVVSGAFAYSINLTHKANNNTPIFGKHDVFRFESKNFKWYNHPDSTIDLVAIPLVPILMKMPRGKNGYAYYSILEDDIPLQNELEELKGIEELYMIGYPIGIYDEYNNMPISRKGITATHPILNYKGKPEFVIDAACYPGSSGSPILIVNEGAYSFKGGIKMGKRRLFMGILYAGPTYLPDGSIKIIEIPTRKDAVSIFSLPINLGYVIKSNKILDFKGVFGLK